MAQYKRNALLTFYSHELIGSTEGARQSKGEPGSLSPRIIALMGVKGA